MDFVLAIALAFARQAQPAGQSEPSLPPAAVAKVLVVPKGSRVRVFELAQHGVEPIELSLVDVVPTTPFLPSVRSIAPEIEIQSVDLLSAP